jgi:uncharacterized protein
MIPLLWMLPLGLGAGVLSGLFGVGGGVVIVPFLVWGLGYPQKTASATSMVALLMPVGVLGVWNYYRSGVIDAGNIKVGLLIAVGLAIGALAGSKIAMVFSDLVLKRSFAVFLVFIAARMFYSTLQKTP